MFGILEEGERLPTKEEKAVFVEKMFNISMATPEMLVLYNPISVEDFEMCIEILEIMSKGAKKIIDEQIKRGGINGK